LASNALTVVGQHASAVLPKEDEFSRMVRMAELYAKSGILPKGINNMAAAALVIEQGYELGIPPAAALRTISLIEGKPTLDASMQRALIFRDHGDDALRFVETDATHCVIEYKRRGWAEHARYTLTMAEIPAKLRSKDNWQSYPANMLRARATTFVAVMAFSDSTLGLYTPEEMGADVDVGPDGEPVVIAHVESEPPRAIGPASTPIEQPRSAPLSAARTKPMPNGREQAAAKLIADAKAKGVTLDADDTPGMWADDIDAALDAAGSTHRVPRDEQGTPLAGALSKALLALPRREIDAETGEVREEDAGE
jgi:hypothetical protein